jgi:hypothetical protein
VPHAVFVVADTFVDVENLIMPSIKRPLTHPTTGPRQPIPHPRDPVAPTNNGCQLRPVSLPFATTNLPRKFHRRSILAGTDCMRTCHALFYRDPTGKSRHSHVPHARHRVLVRQPQIRLIQETSVLRPEASANCIGIPIPTSGSTTSRVGPRPMQTEPITFRSMTDVG